MNTTATAAVAATPEEKVEKNKKKHVHVLPQKKQKKSVVAHYLSEMVQSIIMSELEKHMN